MKSVTAKYWTQSNASKDSKESINIKCLLCPHGCVIPDGQTGKCGVRKNENGKLIASAYGQITSIALDPIEKKPLYEFHSGKRILSIGSFGCNFHCPFCQNYTISMEYENINKERVTPEEILDIAVRSTADGNIGVAYTYNEPLINLEYIKDCSTLIKKAGLVNVLVTNGYINEEPLNEILPLIDAMNIDIKGVTQRTYKMVGGTLEKLKQVVERSHKSCHVEVTTLIIPDENENDVEEIAKWLASIDKKIPYHLSRFFPRYKYKNCTPTPFESMYKARDIAGKYLEKVYLGNM